MEEIDLKDLWNYFISKIALLVVFVAVAVIISNVYLLWVQKPMYKSEATLVLTRSANESGEVGAITTNDININQKLVSTYGEIIKSKRVLSKVIKNLELNVDSESLSKKVSVSNKEDTELLKISVSSDNSELAQKIANEIADVFSEEIVKIYNIQNISIIDYAEEQTKPYNVNIFKQSVIAVVLGIVLSCAVIFVMFYFDTTIKSPEEVEEKTGIVVLGRVPIVNSNKKKKSKKVGNK